MVIAFDIDGTISRRPEFFSTFARALLTAGHEVLIITIRDDRAIAEQLLTDWHIPYSRLITSTLADTIASGVDQWKGVVCRTHHVDVLFDDSPEVLHHVDADVLTLLVTPPDPTQGGCTPPSPPARSTV